MQIDEQGLLSRRMLMVRAVGQFWLVDRVYADSIESVICNASAAEIMEARRETARAAEADAIEAAQEDTSKRRKPYQILDGIAYVNMAGMMTKQATSMQAMFGGVSTKATEAALMQAAEDKSVRSIMLVIDSPGGDVSGAFDLAQCVWAINRVKPIDAYIEDTGASAAYLVASQCRSISANSNALVGSIGIICCLTDTTGYDKQRGIKKTWITTGPLKGAGHGMEVSDEHLAAAQKRADDFMGLFVKAVSKGRNLDEKAMASVATGDVFVAGRAKKLGLVDTIQSLGAAHAAALDAPTRPARKPVSKGEAKMAGETEVTADVSDVRRWLETDADGTASAALLVAQAPAALTEPATALAAQPAAPAPMVAAFTSEQAAFLASAASAGITTPEHLTALINRATTGDEYIAILRKQTKAMAVVALGQEIGAQAADVIDAQPLALLRGMARQYEAIAVDKGLMEPLAGTPMARTTAPGEHPQVGRTTAVPKPKVTGAVADSGGQAQPTDEERVQHNVQALRGTGIYGM